MLVEIKEKNQWQDQSEFLQAWDYGDFLKKINRHIIRLENIDMQIQCLINQTKLGIKSAYLPRVELNNGGATEEVLNYFKNNHYTFVQIEPVNNITIPKKYKFYSIENLQTPQTLILDVTKNEEELISAMHQKTRYNIRLAEKKGIKISQDKNPEIYWQLHLQTIARDNFVSHSKKYIDELLKLKNVYQLTAYNNEKPIAGAILLHHQNTLYYFFGASANEDRELMAPYLLHWEIIKFAKKLNCQYYDFWGMAEFTNKDDKTGECRHGLCWKKDHPFAGVSRFKAGFGGKAKIYPPAIEIVLNPFKYKIYKLINLLKKPKVLAGHPIKK